MAPAATRERPSGRIASPLKGSAAGGDAGARAPVDQELVLAVERSPSIGRRARAGAIEGVAPATGFERKRKSPLRWKLRRQPASDCRRRHSGEGSWSPGRVPPSPQRPAISPAPARPSPRTRRAARRRRPPRSRRARSKAGVDPPSAAGAQIPGRRRSGRRILRCACPRSRATPGGNSCSATRVGFWGVGFDALKLGFAEQIVIRYRQGLLQRLNHRSR